MKLLYFLLINQNYIFLAMFAMLAVVALVNFAHNPYAKQNTQLKKFNKKTLQKPSSIVLQTKRLPQEYQRQWRAYTNSGCNKPSTVFEFVKRPQRYLLWFAHFVSMTVCVVYLLISIYLQDSAMFAIQIAFIFLGLIVLLVTRLIGHINLAHARRVFGKFLHDLNAVTALLKGNQKPSQPTNLSTNQMATTPSESLSGATPTDSQAPTSTLQSEVLPQTSTGSGTTQPLPTTESTDPQPTTTLPTDLSSQLPQSPTDSLPTPKTMQTDKNSGDVIEKAVQILRQKGLDNPRTAEEQRKLNIALNNLLQACCKKM